MWGKTFYMWIKSDTMTAALSRTLQQQRRNFTRVFHTRNLSLSSISYALFREYLCCIATSFLIERAFYILISTGMVHTWGCTIGAIGNAIITSALLPIPPNTINKGLCVAVMLWEYLFSFSLLIARIYLAALLLPFMALFGVSSGLFLLSMPIVSCCG